MARIRMASPEKNKAILPGVKTPKSVGNSFGNNQVQFCNGGYIARSGCYPFCPSPSGWGCDTGTQGGSNPLGLTQNYTVTTGDVSAGNTSTRAYTPVIDPYQRITPNMLSYSGYSNFDGAAVKQNWIPLVVLGLSLVVGIGITEWAANKYIK
tara:strand:- start:1033 stop:1488 length:456 start_codon:yes stop_codon:yes gene_type:complete